jgi:hypothetical protein
MRHSLPNVQSGIDACGDGALDKSLGVVQKHFILPDLHTDRIGGSPVKFP